MIRHLILIIFVNTSLLSQAQNYIRNGGFSEVSCCPQLSNMTQCVPPWFSPNIGTPDFFHSCSNSGGYSIPSNTFGFQNYNNNDGYIGIATYYSNVNNEVISEYISVELIRPLTNRVYELKFFINLADRSYYYTDHISAYFSSQPLNVSAGSLFGFSPIVSCYNGLFSDTTDWQEITIKVSGDDSYKYLTLGHFIPLNQMNLNVNNSVPGLFFVELYYFIDDVQLYPLDYHPHLADTILCSQEPLLIEAPYYEDMSYSWYHNGQWLSDSSSLYLEQATEGWYYLHYINFRNENFTDSAYVEIIDCGNVQLPNVFTPNGDGVHDVWTPIVQDIDQLEIQIFSRWGKLVHQYSGSASNYSGWVGGDSPDGTYFAVVKAKGYNGSVLEEKGTITLLR
jgi:gliding motility-associated-like protein